MFFAWLSAFGKTANVPPKALALLFYQNVDDNT
jgi:hypothetical protein